MFSMKILKILLLMIPLKDTSVYCTCTNILIPIWRHLFSKRYSGRGPFCNWPVWKPLLILTSMKTPVHILFRLKANLYTDSYQEHPPPPSKCADKYEYHPFSRSAVWRCPRVYWPVWRSSSLTARTKTRLPPPCTGQYDDTPLCTRTYVQVRRPSCTQIFVKTPPLSSSAYWSVWRPRSILISMKTLLSYDQYEGPPSTNCNQSDEFPFYWQVWRSYSHIDKSEDPSEY